MSKLLARIKVIASSAVTYLVLAAAAVPRIASVVAGELPAYGERIVAIGGTVAGALLAAVAIIRIVMPAPSSTHGVIAPPLDVEQRHAYDAAHRYLRGNPQLTPSDLLAAVAELDRRAKAGDV